MYSATRTLWYMASTNQAPKLFKYTTSYGLPLNALLATALVGSIVFLTSFINNGILFSKLLNISSSCGFIAWFGIALSHYYFRKQPNINPNKLIYKAVAFPFGPIFSMVLIAIIILGQGYPLWSNFSLSGFIDAYGALVLFLLLMFCYSFLSKKKEISVL
jgi:lysine-specific permease